MTEKPSTATSFEEWKESSHMAPADSSFWAAAEVGWKARDAARTVASAKCTGLNPCTDRCDGETCYAAEQLARKFHEAYERLAPEFGYETRSDTREFDPDHMNGRLMIAVCAEILESTNAK